MEIDYANNINQFNYVATGTSEILNSNHKNSGKTVKQSIRSSSASAFAGDDSIAWWSLLPLDCAYLPTHSTVITPFTRRNHKTPSSGGLAYDLTANDCWTPHQRIQQTNTQRIKRHQTKTQRIIRHKNKHPKNHSTPQKHTQIIRHKRHTRIILHRNKNGPPTKQRAKQGEHGLARQQNKQQQWHRKW